MKIIATNKKAKRNFEILQTYEAGLALQGAEVKSLRDGKVSLKGAYAAPRRGEIWLLEMHISRYNFDSAETYDPVRPRKLLLHSREIKQLTKGVEQKGQTIVVLRLYFERGYAKAEIALARGKKRHDKRDDIKKRDAELEAKRRVKGDN
ncbi:MAG: SsrA-binding protein SmpB [bacterium]|nr:SsrA-binding protein SmpB [bacterium]